MSFADAEDRLNASAFARVANASARIGGNDYSVIFDSAVQSSLGGLVDAAQPGIYILDADLGANGMGTAITVTYKGASKDYLARGPMPDGTGVTFVALENA